MADGRGFLYVALSADPAQAGIYQGTLTSPHVTHVLAGATSFAPAGERLLSLDNRPLIVQSHVGPARQGLSIQPTEALRDE